MTSIIFLTTGGPVCAPCHSCANCVVTMCTSQAFSHISSHGSALTTCEGYIGCVDFAETWLGSTAALACSTKLPYCLWHCLAMEASLYLAVPKGLSEQRIVRTLNCATCELSEPTEMHLKCSSLQQPPCAALAFRRQFTSKQDGIFELEPLRAHVLPQYGC
jgi:hypothetical protein